MIVTLKQPTDRFWTDFYRLREELTADDARHMLHNIAAELHCSAVIMTGADLAQTDAPAAGLEWTAEAVSAGEDPRTAEQIDADTTAAEWRNTYNSLLP